MIRFDATKNPATKATAYAAVVLAQYHVGTSVGSKSSAKLCADDAVGFYNAGKYGYAHEWARESLAHSVGVLHPAYAKLEGEARS